MNRPLDEMQAFRAQELLLQRATEGLSAAEAAELAALGADDDISFDLAAAAVDLATLQVEPLPAGVADKVLAAAGLAPARPAIPTTLAGVVAAPIRTTPLPADVSQPFVAHPSAQSAAMSQAAVREAPVIPIRRSRAPLIIAYTAMAAGLAIGIGSFLWARSQKPETITRIDMPASTSPELARRDLLAAAGDVTTLAWSATPDPAAAGAKGDVVWSPSKQEGYMRFTGLAANDPKKLQYQLWIFDKDRDDKYPVDGGVFDVGPDGEVVIKISPKLHVNQPVLFAVTVEQPGGVVVSKRERIVVTAAPPKTG